MSGFFCAEGPEYCPTCRTIWYHCVMKIFILRWNPAISSWTDGKFREALVACREGPFAMDWSIRDWESVEYGDIAVLCRVGTDADGIVAVGWFDGRVEESQSWRRDGTKCHYAFFWMRLAQDPVETGLLSAAVLEKAVPGIGWHGGHSGIVLPSESAPALARIIAEALERGPILPGAANFECRLRFGCKDPWSPVDFDAIADFHANGF